MDLHAPLGLKPPPKRRGRVVLPAFGLAVAVGLAGIGYFFITADPHGGEPYAIVPVPTQNSAKNAVVAPPPDLTPTGSIARGETARNETGTPGVPQNTASIEGGIKVFRGGMTPQNGAPSGGPLVIDVTKAMDEQARKRTAAPPAQGADSASSTPRIAIFVSGMGLSSDATRTVIGTMPAGVDLAFVPYGDTVAASVANAKAKGHEVLLQIPMQTGRGATPGPHALAAGEPQQQIAEDFAWLSSRYSGYTGVTNLLGAPVTADTAVMTALLKAVGTKGLFYLDDGTSKRSVSASTASGLGVSVLQTDVVLDATSDPSVVRANLDRLMAIAKEKGQAIGMASGLPEHLDMIARFAGDLGGKGITLVPISALAGRDSSMAAAR